MAELFLLHPIFPGVDFDLVGADSVAGNSEVDQIFRICSVIGTPTHWPEGVRLGQSKGIAFPTG